MVNELLVNLVNSVLGSGKRTARGNQAYTCPFCHHYKPKLEVNFTENKEGNNPWNCWTCGKRGKTVRSLFKQIQVDASYFQELSKLVKNVSSDDIGEVKHILLELPKEFKTFLNNQDITARHALSYLKKRNISKTDILKYNIGYCASGQYANMIVIPSYDCNGKLNYFTARSFEKDPYVKYRNPEVSRDIIAFELFVNWDLPIILCEGPFDALAIKRNVIPLFGKNLQPSLMKKLVESKVQKIYIALDNDAMKQALGFCEQLLDIGKEVYLVELQGKDPSEMGFEHFTKLIQTVSSLTQYKLMEKKLSLI
jgi:transcription elongation factor Elf1